MADGKGFSRQVSPELLNSGVLHAPSLARRHLLEEYDGTPDHMRHMDTLALGAPVVASMYVGEVRGSRGIEPIPSKMVESRRSAHGVGFGRFLGRSALGRTTEVSSVALKPFDGPEKALHEMYGYGILQEMGIETFDPIGVFPARQGEHFIVVTKKRTDLMSLDRDLWVAGGYINSEKDASTAERNNRTVIEISEKLADLHAQGVFHPDGQIKNWAVTPEGEIGVIDTENLTKLQLNDIDTSTMAWADIEKLTKSLIFANTDDETKLFGVGMFAGLPIATVRSRINQLIITPYVERLMVVAEEAEANRNLAVLEQTQKLIDGAYKLFESQDDWPRHIVDMQYVSFDRTKELASARK